MWPIFSILHLRQLCPVFHSCDIFAFRSANYRLHYSLSVVEMNPTIFLIAFFASIVGAHNVSGLYQSPVSFDWDPKDPPLWTIRPEDRDAYFNNKTAFLEKRSGDPCSSRDHHALRMYHQYWEADCPAKYHIQPDGTCEKWADVDVNCGSFCQIR